MKILRLLFFLIFSLSLFAQDYSQKYSAELKQQITQSPDDWTVLVWIFFKDKGHSLNKYFEKPTTVVSEESLERRAKVLKGSELIDETDLPVNKNYIKELEDIGVKVKQVSRWFNGISSLVKISDLPEIASKSFVKNIDMVGIFKKEKEPVFIRKNFPREINFKKQSAHLYDYGSSFAQLDQIKVPDVHDLGLTGKGIMICVMDAGVSNLSHEVFSQIKIKAKYDFVNHDTVVANQADSGEGSHGTYTLALIGGFKPGELIGPAFNATYLLAKTENTQSESPIEEDNWIAAMEWADSIGVQVTSTSLGYLDGFDFGFKNYTWQDMNGRTARITLGAELAARKGIVVVNSAGNEAWRGTPNTLVAPADADSIITVGAVDVNGKKASFSSYGPTTDRRIKPDVMADGVSDYIPVATPGNINGYITGSGTSFSCPLVAGVAALILEKHPNWTPIQVRDALRNTASMHTAPDSLYGWGIINALAAVNYSQGNGGGSGQPPKNVPDSYELAQNYPNPFNPSTTIKYQIKDPGFVTLKVYNLLGNLVATLVNEYEPPGTYYIDFNAKSGDEPLPSGVYFYRLQVGNFIATKKMVVMK